MTAMAPIVGRILDHAIALLWTPYKAGALLAGFGLAALSTGGGHLEYRTATVITVGVLAAADAWAWFTTPAAAANWQCPECDTWNSPDGAACNRCLATAH